MNDKAQYVLDDLHYSASVTAPVSSLNIGNQQLVEIAKALSLNARILIMDEPTSALSETETEVLFSVVKRLKDRGVSVIYISHRIAEMFVVADRVTILRDGYVVDVMNVSDVSRKKLIRMMVGRDINQFFVHKEEPRGDVVIKVTNLSRTKVDFSGKPFVNNVSFAVRSGENLGIAGLLGAGRTELLEALFGADPSNTDGIIELNGVRQHFNNPLDAIESGIALITEDRKGNGLVSSLNITHNMTLAALKQVVRSGVLSREKEKELAESYINRLSITLRDMENPIESLSGGNQQKVLIAKWLATHPKVLLLDDPTRGIDVGAKHEIYKPLSELSRQGMGIVMVSSEISELLSLCDRILVMCEGEISAVFNREEATQEKILDAAAPLGVAP